MRRTNLENWIENIEALPELTREGLESIQLNRLNEMLGRVKARGGIYKNIPDHLEKLEDLQTLPFTTEKMLAKMGGATPNNQCGSCTLKNNIGEIFFYILT